MTGTPKPPEGISGEGQNNTATAWDTLREYPANIEKAPRKHIDTIMAPERASTIGEYASSGLIFSDMVGLAKDLAEEKNRHNPKTSEESQPVLLIFGGVCVPVYENSDTEKLETAWARVMRGHYDKQMARRRQTKLGARLETLIFSRRTLLSTEKKSMRNLKKSSRT